MSALELSEPSHRPRWPTPLLRRGMLALFALVVFAGLGLSWFIAHSGNAVMAASAPLLRQEVPLLEQISALKTAMVRQQLLLNQYYALTLDQRTFADRYARSQQEVRGGLAAISPLVHGQALEEVRENYGRMLSAGIDLVTVMGQDEVDWDLARTKLGDLAVDLAAAELGLDQLLRETQGEVLAGGDATLSRVAMMVKLVAAYATLIMLAALLVAEYIRLRHRAELELAHQATHDMLTGLGNRRKFERAIAALGATDRTVMLIAVERFEPLLSGLGLAAADALLQALSERLREAFIVDRSAELFHVDRQGFVALLPTPLPFDSTTTLAQQVDGVMQRPFRLGQQEVFLSLCTGLSRYPDDGMDSVTLLRHADLARRAGCRDGSHVTHYRSVTDDGASGRLVLEADLHRALERQEFVLHYQPQVDARNGALIGAEALIRWHRPAGIVAPENFVPLAEETGLIVPIGEWVLRTACRDAALWQRAGGQPLSVAVNVSAWQFRHPRFVDAVAAALKESGLPPALLELEVTESAMMGEDGRAQARLRQLKELGVKLAVDDFGTGYSSLAYLKHLPFDRLKIDQAFVRNLSSGDNGAVAKAIIRLGHGLGLEVIAEGVETDPQRRWLARHRCDALQGYLFARPLTIHQFEAWRADGETAAVA